MAAGVDLVFTVGAAMRAALRRRCRPARRGAHGGDVGTSCSPHRCDGGCAPGDVARWSRARSAAAWRDRRGAAGSTAGSRRAADGLRTGHAATTCCSRSADQFELFNLFRYLTFRSGGAVLTALLISFVVGPGASSAGCKRKQGEGQPIRADGPESHLLTKKGTPTMGGVMILLALSISTLLWADLANGLCLGRAAGDARLRRASASSTTTSSSPSASSSGLAGPRKLLGQALIALDRRRR